MKIEEILREMEEFHRKMTEDVFRGFGSFDEAFPDFDSLEEKVKSGELEGDWSYEPIERPGTKGYIIRGFFSTPHLSERPPLERPTDILPPVKPNLREPREPLYDIAVEKDRLLVFIELPGVEEEEIRLDAGPRSLKVRAGGFEAEIDLSPWVAKTEERTTEYRNGVLKVVIPRTELDEQLI